MGKPKILGHYDRVRVQHTNDLPSMTKQSFKEQCDINHIINKYDNTGLITHLNQAQAHYGDVTALQDYQDALDRIHAVESVFNSLPAKTRDAFNNSPATFLDYANDPEKRELLHDLGLIEGPPPSDPPPAANPGGASSEAGDSTPDPAPGGAGPEGSAS